MGAFDDAGAWVNAAQIVAIVAAIHLVVTWIAMIIWTLRDIRNRTDDTTFQGIAVLLVAAFHIPGLLLYLVLRPQETMAEAYSHRLEVEMLMQDLGKHDACPSCSRRVDDQFIACPYCRASLKSGCQNCGRQLFESWVVCPFCSTERAGARPAARQAPRTAARVASAAAGAPAMTLQRIQAERHTAPPQPVNGRSS